jgi:hypothetical protein
LTQPAGPRVTAHLQNLTHSTRDEPAEGRLLLCTGPDLPALVVIRSCARRRAVEPLFAAVRHGWGLEDARRQSRQVLMRWVTILAAGYALGQVLAYADPARTPGVTHEIRASVSAA